MTASQSLALFKTPVARGGFSTDSASSSCADRRSSKPAFPQPSPGPLTGTLPDLDGALLLGLGALAVPSAVYGLFASGLLSGGLLENAVRAFLR